MKGKTAGQLFEEAGWRLLERESLKADVHQRETRNRAQDLDPSDSARFVREVRNELRSKTKPGKEALTG